MRNPWRYLNLNPATQLSQLLVSYSLKKSSELLLEPFISLLEASPFFERCQRKEQMKEAEEAYQNSDTVDKLFWTTAYKTSALGFSSGSTIKIASSPNGLLGLSIISIVYSELAFFTDAGKSSDYIMRLYNDGKARIRSRLETNQIDEETGNKIVDYYGRALSYDEYIVTETGPKSIKDIQVGDKIKTPNGYSFVDCIPFDQEDDIYEIELEDGRTIKCNLDHLWPCKTSKGKDLLSTKEILEKINKEDISLYSL